MRRMLPKGGAGARAIPGQDVTKTRGRKGWSSHLERQELVRQAAVPCANGLELEAGAGERKAGRAAAWCFGANHDCQCCSDEARLVPGGGIRRNTRESQRGARKARVYGGVGRVYGGVGWGLRQTNFEPELTSCGGIETAALSAFRIRPLEVLHWTASATVTNEEGMFARTDRM